MDIVTANPPAVYVPDDDAPVAETVVVQPREKDSWTEDEVYEWIAASMRDRQRESGGGW